MEDPSYCSFYWPKQSSQAQLLEGKANLLHLRQDMPLSDAELAAVDDGIVAMENLTGRLADIPTPEGPTPRELSEQAYRWDVRESYHKRGPKR